MNELLKDTLYEFDGKIRIELGPQIVELMCTPENIHNSATHANYQIGKVDAYGKVIKLNEPMSCIDWKETHAPKLWKVYQLKEVNGADRFIKINEFLSKEDAINMANLILKEEA